MQKFLALSQMNVIEIQKLIDLTLRIKNQELTENDQKMIGQVNGKYVTTIFLEPSTRTKLSFEVAAQNLSMRLLNLDAQTSSFSKGETLQDTIDTLEALGCSAVVIRSSEEFYYEKITTDLAIINGGDGANEHPSQALLDLVTIYEQFGEFAGLNVLIVGDIKHSRVASTNIKVMKRLEMNVQVYAPHTMKVPELEVEYLESMDDLSKFDVVMLLRNQLERHNEKLLDEQTFLKEHGMTSTRLNTLKASAIVMHPGPFNRGVELDEQILKDSRVKIFEQVTNGVHARTAIFMQTLGELKWKRY
ncbi:MAG: aspartate carbamoyltransferase catalytic subunit [Mycoplasmatales bacterium]